MNNTISTLLETQNKVLGQNTNSDDKRLRKKLQNRVNQRARRLRIQAEKSHNIPDGKESFKVHRWRVGFSDGSEVTDNQPHRRSDRASSPPATLHPDNTVTTEVVPASKSRGCPSATVYFHDLKACPSADQLLHLIQYNTFRGLLNNKVILGRTALAWQPGQAPQRFDASFPTFSVVFPIAEDLPAELNPTASQRSLLHSSWINTIPFPTMRENFMRWEMSFNHWEFASDVMGDILPPILFPQPEGPLATRPLVQGRVVVADEGDEGDGNDEITTDRNGLILWGEPYRAESWEATPGFLRKWAWAVQGCDDLIESSNRWRSFRGEGPLLFSVTMESEE